MLFRSDPFEHVVGNSVPHQLDDEPINPHLVECALYVNPGNTGGLFSSTANNDNSAWEIGKERQLCMGDCEIVPVYQSPMQELSLFAESRA